MSVCPSHVGWLFGILAVPLPGKCSPRILHGLFSATQGGRLA